MKLVILCGPSGSGKSTLAKEYQDKGFSRISQDDQGKLHLSMFIQYVSLGLDIVVDRMSFNKQQRERYLKPAKERGYETEIIVLHESRDTCFKRCIARIGKHPTVHTAEDANSALDTFFTRYERPTLDEADSVVFKYPTLTKNITIAWFDLDGTLCNTDHRQGFMEGPKKNWPGFFGAMDKDPLNKWCKDIIEGVRGNNLIVLASGRPDNYKKTTEQWLEKNCITYDYLFMRHRSDSRRDDVVKQIILDFEVKTRGNVLFAVDDRLQVVEMLRSRGVTVLQCAPGNF